MSSEPKKEIEKETPSAAGGGKEGRGGRSGGRGERGRRGGRNRARNTGSNTHVPKSAFKGECKPIEDAIFDSSSPHQSTGYAASIKRIADYVGRNYEESGDIRRVIEKMELPTMTPQPLADDANKMAEKIWDLE